MSDQENVYRALQKHLDQLPVGYPATASGVEIEILKILFKPEEALFATYLGFIPEPSKQIQERVTKNLGIDIDPEVLEKKLDGMLNNGLLNGFTDPSTGKKLYANAFLAMGMFDYWVDRMTGELRQAVDRYIDDAWLDEYKSSGIPQLRTIPIGQSVESESCIASYDDVRHLIETRRPIRVTECVCRKGKQLLGETCKKGAPLETCFQFGASAHMYKNLGLGREVTKEEAHQIISKAEESGLVIQPSNAQKPNSICCCCGCCCIIITHAKKISNPLDVFVTSYRASTSAEACVGCGICIERCPMDASHLNEQGISMVNEKLCIGCGVCVPSCSSNARRLVQLQDVVVPPADLIEMFMKIGMGKERAHKATGGLT